MVLGLFKKKAEVRPKAALKPAPKPKPRPVSRPKPKPAAKAKPKPAPKAVHKAKPVAVPKKPVLPIVEKLADEKAYEMIKAAKIPVVPYIIIKSEKELPDAFKKLGFPMVLKASGRSIVHKTELGGVKFAGSEFEAAAAFQSLMKIKGCEKVLVQKRLSGLELIIGAKSDPQFGTVVSIGLGGAFVEVLRDVAFRVVPVTAADAAAMVRELKGYDILAGARGQPAINFAVLYDVLVRVGNLAAREKLKEMDINPLFCTAEGCWAADVRIVK